MSSAKTLPRRSLLARSDHGVSDQYRREVQADGVEFRWPIIPLSRPTKNESASSVHFLENHSPTTIVWPRLVPSALGHRNRNRVAAFCGHRPIRCFLKNIRIRVWMAWLDRASHLNLFPKSVHPKEAMVTMDDYAAPFMWLHYGCHYLDGEFSKLELRDDLGSGWTCHRRHLELIQVVGQTRQRFNAD